MSLKELVGQSGLQGINLPKFEELMADSEIAESEPPPFFSDYFGTGSASSYEEPSPSSDYGDLPESGDLDTHGNCTFSTEG